MIYYNYVLTIFKAYIEDEKVMQFSSVNKLLLSNLFIWLFIWFIYIWFISILSYIESRHLKVN